MKRALLGLVFDVAAWTVARLGHPCLVPLLDLAIHVLVWAARRLRLDNDVVELRLRHELGEDLPSQPHHRSHR